jgi:hypothetical protein
VVWKCEKAAYFCTRIQSEVHLTFWPLRDFGVVAFEGHVNALYGGAGKKKNIFDSAW